MSETAAKKDVQKLQRAIVDGLEDVKAQDIRVFNTEHLSPLFERVIVASGNSNRQTKALAASVRDKVREGGFAKPRIEGEENGEWIIVDCGPAVAHIMQPAIRQYYNLEEIWGEKTVKLKGPASKKTAAKPAAKKTASEAKAAPAPARKVAAASKKVAAKKSAAPAAASKPTAKAPVKTAAKAAAAKKPAAKSAAKPAAKTPAKAPARKAPAKKAAPVKTLVVGKPAAAKKAAAKKTAPRKSA